MTTLVTLSLRIEPATKSLLADLADGMGASMSALFETFVNAYLPDAFDHDPDLANTARRLTAERRAYRSGAAAQCSCVRPPLLPAMRGPHHVELCRMWAPR